MYAIAIDVFVRDSGYIYTMDLERIEKLVTAAEYWKLYQDNAWQPMSPASNEFWKLAVYDEDGNELSSCYINE